MNIETWFNTAHIKRHYFPGRIFVGAGVFNKAIELCIQSEGVVVIIVDAYVYDLPFVREQLARFEHRESNLKVTRGEPVAQDVECYAQELHCIPAVILSIGGGSVTDFAKALTARLLFGEFDGVGLGGNVNRATGISKPVLVSVPTTAGSGAEASRYFVTYDRDERYKVFGRSWQIVSDWIMLDPIFLRSAPDALLVSCAFDVFIHLFESMICRYESSWMGRTLSLNGIPRVMSTLGHVINDGKRGDLEFSALLEMASVGGLAISNVRTGNIHEAAGALLELTNLSHPETLFVFFRSAVEQYLIHITTHEEALISHLRLIPAFNNFNRMEDIISWWETLFKRVGLSQNIQSEIGELVRSKKDAKSHIVNRLLADEVWISKESPMVLDEVAISSFVDQSIANFT